MIELKAKALKWGNSVGLRLSKYDAKKAKIKIGREMNIIIQENKRLNMNKVFGSLKDWKKPTEQIMKEIDEGW